MRLSIWQQFSSNHSGGFDIVGVFESAEAAAQAAAQLGEILRAIAQARDEYAHYEASPTLVERKFSAEYGIEWSSCSIDWIKMASDNTPLNLTRLDQYLFISNLEIDNTQLDSVPVGALIERLGGKALIGEGVGMYSGDVIAFSITCTAPDIEAARAIYEEVESHLAIARARNLPESSPWSSFVALNCTDTTAYYGHVACEGTLLRLWNLNFGPEFIFTFPGVIAYLKAHGCANIAYTVEARDVEDVYDRQEDE